MSFQKNYPLNSMYFLTLIGLTLTGCDTTREALGLKRNQPDEFTVLQTAPLTLPPNFNDLPTPEPGADRPQESSSREKARQALLENTELNQDSEEYEASGGETAILDKVGAQEALPNIRQIVDKEANVESKEQESFIKNITSFGKKKPGKVIDPVEENKELNKQGKSAITH
ncbi:MAG: DUF3035 domain-containing protein [Alphaproteobacteria bacterium]|nr:DUF3035 domain-containing protein [Alphaproteobacteria bacterium]